MDNNSVPLVSDLVLVGGGHAHVHVLKMLGMPEGRRVCQEFGIRCTLIARDVHTPYSGMLPGYVSGHYTFDEIHLDLAKLCRFANVRLIHGSAAGIRPHNKKNGGVVKLLEDRPPVRYDALSIDIGSAPSGTPPCHVVPVKPIAHFAQKYESLCKKIQQHAKHFSENSPFVLLVVGGGAGGIELALAMQVKLQSILLEAGVDKEALQVTIATRGKSVLEQHNTRVRQIFERVLKERRVQVRYGAQVESVEVVSDKGDKKVCVLTADSDNQEPIIFDECLWCTSAGVAPWLVTSSPLATTADGFVEVKDTYESTSHKGIFAAGDCCHMIKHPRPKAGVFAVRAGPPLVHNMLAYLTGKPLQSFIPQKEFLGLISTGDKNAVASRGYWFAKEGSYIWTWKDHIDRKWMNNYTELPDLEEMMEDFQKQNLSYNTTGRGKTIPQNVRSKGSNVMEAFAADPMRCGGCGAKVGATTVSRVLQAVHARQVARCHGNDVPPPLDHDDAAVVPIPNNNSGRAGMICTIDYFRSIVSDPFLFGKIAAVHALSDVHAMGASAETALALAVVPFSADEDITESTLVDLLSGASDVFQEEGIRVVGGHTCEGAEMACGFAIHGFSPDTSTLLRKRGGRVGDKIVLTKALGTGALFASDMRAKCKGEHVVAALGSMIKSNVSASRTAMEEDAVHACTDVTGFGLMGHLLEMLMANDDDAALDTIGATLNIQDIPFLSGALEASRQGIFSSLQVDNARNRRAVSNHKIAAETCPVEYPLLFDPQTAGGLLFFVSPGACEEFVSKLQVEYGAASVIGELVKHEVSRGDDSAGVCTIASQGKSTGERVHIKL